MPSLFLRESGCVSALNCFELLDLLKAHKGIRRAAVNSFGYIAKSLGPQDVLSVLLTNLCVQERQSCAAVAIAMPSWRKLVDVSHDLNFTISFED